MSRTVSLDHVRNIGIAAHIGRRQDNHHGADPVLFRCGAQAGRGSRRRGRNGLDGPGKGAGHHHHCRRHLHQLAGPPHQHHRHPRPRGLHHRGGALHAGSGRSHCRVLRRGWRPAPVGNRLAPGGPLPGAPHGLCQQDGPHRRRLPECPRANQIPPAGQRLPDPTAHWR